VPQQLDPGATDAVLMVKPAASLVALEFDRDAATCAKAKLGWCR
jgi:hypothetical protein